MRHFNVIIMALWSNIAKNWEGNRVEQCRKYLHRQISEATVFIGFNVARGLLLVRTASLAMGQIGSVLN